MLPYEYIVARREPDPDKARGRDAGGLEVDEPAADLCCYQANGPALPPGIKVPIEDEFGSLQLQIKKATMVCEPCTAIPLP